MRKSRYGLHVGTASILLIFLTLCLISFAVLTFVNAHADAVLTDKLVEQTSAYYTTCHEAQAFAASAETALRNGEAVSAYEKDIPVSGLQHLQVTLSASGTDSASDPASTPGRLLFFSTHQLVTDDSGLVYDNSLHLGTGSN